MAAWPVEVEEIALVGHSMGGLVARSACYHGVELGHDWVGRVRHVVSLGTPHMGAPLAQGVHYAAHALHAVPETRPFARFLRRRSAGIRDLRQGSLVDRDWERLRPRRAARGGLRRGAAARRRDALLRHGDDHAHARPPGRAPDRRRARARRRARQAAAARAGSRSASRTGCTSAARITSRCSITRRCTSGCASGSTQSPSQSLRRAVLGPEHGEERLVELALARPPVARVDRVRRAVAPAS